MNRRRILRTSGLPPSPNAKRILAFAPISLGHSCPQQYPQRCPHLEAPHSLGEPLSICETARVIGCSAWTVRQKLIPLGLPVFRSGPSGRLIFYRDQVVRWIQFRQGGNA